MSVQPRKISFSFGRPFLLVIMRECMANHRSQTTRQDSGAKGGLYSGPWSCLIPHRHSAVPGDDHDINVVLHLPTLARESLAACGLGPKLRSREQHYETVKYQRPLRCTSRVADADGLEALHCRTPLTAIRIMLGPSAWTSPCGRNWHLQDCRLSYSRAQARLRAAHEYDIL